MASLSASESFSSLYNTCRQTVGHLEETTGIFENELQALWHEGRFSDVLNTLEGHRVRILSPGWWNKLQGPDFLNAQVEFNGKVCTGDIELHVNPGDWYAHGHHQDPGYEQVILHVVQRTPNSNAKPTVTASGKHVATLVFPGALFAEQTASVSPAGERCGKCGAELADRNPNALHRFLDLAGEWRILDKARRIRERMERVGPEQATYEAFMAACGYSRFKKAFQTIAEALPYERARQLAQQDPISLEAAFLRLSGLWPETWPYDSAPSDHYLRISGLLREQLPGLKSLDLHWLRSASRPANNPERRLAGAARFLTRTADRGLETKLSLIWRASETPVARRRELEELFGGPTGFWANHYTWNGTQAQRAAAPLGAGRIRAIIGNVLIPAALAQARATLEDPGLERHVYELFIALPREPENHIHRRMVQWLSLEDSGRKLNFRRQQGLMQVHEDWCAHNPSCRQCTLLAFLQTIDAGNTPREETRT